MKKRRKCETPMKRVNKSGRSVAFSDPRYKRGALTNLNALCWGEAGKCGSSRLGGPFVKAGHYRYRGHYRVWIGSGFEDVGHRVIIAVNDNDPITIMARVIIVIGSLSGHYRIWIGSEWLSGHYRYRVIIGS